ncbi:GAF domain-containing protein [Chloroflexota bacterium]
MSNQPQQINPDYRKNALRLMIIRMVGPAILLTLIQLFYPSPETTQEKIIIGMLVFALVTGIISFVFVLRDRIVPGVIIALVGIHITILTIGFLLVDFGFVLMIGVLIVTITMIANILPQTITRQAILAATITGLLVLLVDTLLKDAPFRIAISLLPTTKTLMWLIIAAVILINIPYMIRQFTFFTLRAKLIVTFVSVTLLSLGALAFMNIERSEDALIAEANEALFAAATQTEDSLLDFLNSNKVGVEIEANLPIFQEYLSTLPNEQPDSYLSSRTEATLNTLARKNLDHISSYAILDINGKILVDTDIGEIGSNRADRVYFLQALETSSGYISPVLVSPVTGEASLYFSAPIINRFGQNIGVLRVRYHASILQELIERSNDLVGRDSFAVLFDEHFIHIAHGTEPGTLFQTVMPLEPQLFESLKSDYRLPDWPEDQIYLTLPELNENLNHTVTSEKGIHFFVAEDVATGDRQNQVVAITMEEQNWVLVVFQPQDVFLNPVQQQTNTTILFTIITAGIVVGLAISVSQVLSRPITELTAIAQEVSEGNLEVRAQVITNDEIGILATTFNDMTQQLGSLVTSLEAEVESRTRDLQTRASRLQIAAEVARDATMEQENDALLDLAVTFIKDRFELYHVGLYLLDKREEYAIIAAGSEDTGKLLLESGHRYRVGSDSNIGYVCLIGEPRLAIKNNPASPKIAQHPLLPYTQSQLIIPLRIGEQIIGAIDLHSENADTFDESDIVIFRTMSDQLAIALRKNEYRQEVEQALSELETAYGEFTSEAWQRFIQTKEEASGYRYRQFNVEPAHDSPIEVQQVWERGMSVIKNRAENRHDPDAATMMVVPMKVRGEVIGVLNLKFDTNYVNTETSSMIEDLASRLSLVLENARLVETAQNRVERERVTSELGSRMRETLDMDTVIRTAVTEIGRNLGLEEVEVRLGLSRAPEEPPPPSTASGGNGHKDGQDEGVQNEKH